MTRQLFVIKWQEKTGEINSTDFRGRILTRQYVDLLIKSGYKDITINGFKTSKNGAFK
jgi:hypothetical protein